MPIDLAAARRVQSMYAQAPVGTRAYVTGRLVVAPLGALGEAFRDVRGRLLSLGSGMCVVERYLAEVQPALEVDAVDLDGEKVQLVARTQERSPRVTLYEGDAATWTGPGGYDAVLVCDLLHHLPPAGQEQVAAVAAAQLRPGGACIVKDLDVRPRWKHEWNRYHDRLVAGPEPIHCQPMTSMVATFERAGLVVEHSARIDRPWTPYAHYLLRLRRPG